jgi:hypothetical protein
VCRFNLLLLSNWFSRAAVNQETKKNKEIDDDFSRVDFEYGSVGHLFHLHLYRGGRHVQEWAYDSRHPGDLLSHILVDRGDPSADEESTAQGMTKGPWGESVDRTSTK